MAEGSVSLVSDPWIPRRSLLSCLSQWIGWKPRLSICLQSTSKIFGLETQVLARMWCCARSPVPATLSPQKKVTRIGNSHNGAHACLCCPYRLSWGEGHCCSMFQHCASSMLRKQLRKTIWRLVNWSTLCSCLALKQIMSLDGKRKLWGDNLWGKLQITEG